MSSYSAFIWAWLNRRSCCCSFPQKVNETACLRENPAWGDMLLDVQDGELETVNGGGEPGGWKALCGNSEWLDLDEKEPEVVLASLLFLVAISA